MAETSWETSSTKRLMPQERKGAPRNIVFYGWWVVLVSALALFCGAPITVFSFSVFFKPVLEDFHTGRAAVSFGFTLHLIASGLGAPFVGWLIVRYGARKVIIPAAAAFGLILIANRAFSTNIWQFYLFYALLGLLLNGVGPIPFGSVVSHWFDRRRGLALGLMMLGIGFGAVLMPSLAHQLIARFGWRTAYALLGVGVLSISIPVVAAFLKERPQDLGLWPDGVTPSGDALSQRAAISGLSRQDAWRTRSFWLMVCAFCLVGASVQACQVHLAALLTDRAITPQFAALGSSLVGVAVLIGRVGTGYLLDRFFAPRVASIFFCGAAVGIGLLWLRSTAPVAFAGAFLVGLGLGAEVDIIAYLISRYFGLRFFAEIYSVGFGAFALASALGVLLMGWGYDLTGSYNVPLVGFLAATLCAALLMTRLGPYRFGPAH